MFFFIALPFVIRARNSPPIPTLSRNVSCLVKPGHVSRKIRQHRFLLNDTLHCVRRNERLDVILEWLALEDVDGDWDTDGVVVQDVTEEQLPK